MAETEHWTQRLSEYLDGELGAHERAACAAHLAECAECAGTLDGLRAVTAQASLLPEISPERDLWPGIEDRLEPRTRMAEAGVVSLGERRRRITATVPQLAAAAVALVVLTAGGMWLMLPTGADMDDQVSAHADVDQAGGAAPVVFLGSYEPAISEMEAVFEESRAELDPETVRVVVENLAIIDRAIAEANEALLDDPSNAFLTAHLAGTMRRKVDLLRRVTTIERTES